MIYADTRTRGEESRLPTFDVRYDGPTRPRRMGHAGMTAEETYAFCALRVDLDAVHRGEWSPEIAPMAWARSSNGAWREWPAIAYLSNWAHDLEAARVTRLPLDVAGTWQLTATLPSGRTRQMYFRTDDRAHAPWTYSAPLGLPLDSPPWEYRTDGYRVGVWMAGEVDDLPTSYNRRVSPCRPTIPSVSVITGRPRVPTGDWECVAARWAWYVDFEDPNRPERTGLWSPQNLADFFLEDEEVQALIDGWIQWWEDVVGQSAAYPDPGSFAGAGPDLAYRATVRLPDGSSILLQAVRVSDEAAAPR
jgi:hypothetical protein